MCGICGIIDIDGRVRSPEDRLPRMVQTITHRGPDDSGIFLEWKERREGALFPFIGLGHSRLSIVSLVIFFLSGGLILTRVDEEEGIRVAREKDAVAA